MSRFTVKYRIGYIFLIIISFAFVYVYAFAFSNEEAVSATQEENSLEAILLNSEDFHSFYQQIRINLIQNLIDNGFDKFAKTPYQPGTFNVHLSGVSIGTSSVTYPDFYVDTRISVDDGLDSFLRTYFREHKEALAHYFIYGELPEYKLPAIVLDQEQIDDLQDIYLFKEIDDLQKLNYDVSSYRLRENKDAQYRINNIYISYYNIGNVRILNPGEEFSFMDEIHYDKNNPGDNIKLSSGLGQAGGVQSMYGGGICGGGFGIFGILAVNKGIEILERHNHTTRYGNLYNNELNGQNVWEPGLDTSVYSFASSRKDLRVKNNRDYPIILVMNYDKTYGGIEETFTLGRKEDRGNFEYLGKRGSCYIREFNGEEFKSCYAKLR